MPFSFRNLFGWAQRAAPTRRGPPGAEPFDVLTPNREAAFLLGEWVTVTSDWIVSAHYDGDARTLEIEIKGGAYYQRRYVEEGEATAFFHAPSKGRWIWQNGWRTGLFLRLTAVSPPQRR